MAILMALVALPGVSGESPEAMSRTYMADYASTWKGVVQTLNELGGSIQNQDKVSGTVSTDWFVLHEAILFSRGWRVKQNFSIEKISETETKVTQRLIFQNKIDSGSQNADWGPASGKNTFAPKVQSNFFDTLDKNNEELEPRLERTLVPALTWTQTTHRVDTGQLSGRRNGSR